MMLINEEAKEGIERDATWRFVFNTQCAIERINVCSIYRLQMRAIRRLSIFVL